ncbi:MAG TPA: cellulase N-terminal Ig-like domain-containing protein, partial [Capsulimonadaceae bacterium]|nr:cellulase N-terminal Ig-like domain-containing protein [Capsulimonadaceae bacterium]
MRSLRFLCPTFLASLSCLAVLAGCAKAEPPTSAIPVITTDSPIRVWVDQIGYRPAAQKIVIVASDNPLPTTLSLSVRDAASGATVWKLSDHPDSLHPFNHGDKDTESGDFVDQLDLTTFTKPGRYFIAIGDGDNAQRSYAFNIADNVYTAAADASWKAYYYESADIAIPAKY